MKKLLQILSLSLITYSVYCQSDLVIKANIKESNKWPYRLVDQLLEISNRELRSTYFSFNGYETNAINLYSEIYTSEPIKNLDQYETIDAISKFEQLLTESKINIVALNEAHHISAHRIFARTLLNSLKKAGFHHIAVEALSDFDKEINGRKYCKAAWSGFYISDPEFSNFLRHAMEMGFTLVPYDAHGGDRDRNSASNICDYMSENNVKKIFIYAGYDHIRENQEKPVSLVDYLKLYMKNEILTISQTEHLPTPFKYDSSLCDPFTTLIQKGNQMPYQGNKQDVDMCVFASYGKVNKRYTKNYFNNLKLISSYNFYKKNYQYPIQIRALRANEGDLAIPEDIINIENESDYQQKDLLLTVGISYIIEIEDSAPSTSTQSFICKKGLENIFK